MTWSNNCLGNNYRSSLGRAFRWAFSILSREAYGEKWPRARTYVRASQLLLSALVLSLFSIARACLCQLVESDPARKSSSRNSGNSFRRIVQAQRHRLSFNRVKERWSLATGFSRKTLYSIHKEFKKSGEKINPSPSKRTRYSKSRLVVNLDDFDLALIRRTVT